MRQPGIAQAGREVQRPDHLRHADARPAGGARVAVRHVGGGFFPVGMDARDLVRRSISTKVWRSTAGTMNTWVTP